MKILKNILLALLGIVVLLLVVSFFLPSKAHVERSLVMKASPETVYKHVSDFKAWDAWLPWNQLDPDMQKTYGEKTQGLGATYSWKSEKKEVGSGSQKIVEAEPNKKVVTEMSFEGMGTSNAGFLIEPAGEGEVKVTWMMDSEGKGLPAMMVPMHKYFSLFMDKMVGPDFEKGLNNLKQVVESDKPSLTIAGYEAAVKEMPAIEYIGVRSKLKDEEISKKFGEYMGQMMNESKEQGVEGAGTPFSIVYSSSNGATDIAFCLPVKSAMKAAGNIKPGNLANTKALVINYYGDYMNTGKVYAPGFEYMSANNLKATGAPREFYITDPMMEKDTAKWLTEVVMPCE